MMTGPLIRQLMQKNAAVISSFRSAQPINGTDQSGYPTHVWLELRWGDPVKSYCQWQIPLCPFLSHFPTWPELSLLVLHFDPLFGILVGRTLCHGCDVCDVHIFSALFLIVPSISGVYDWTPLVRIVVTRVVVWAWVCDPWSVCIWHMPWHIGVFVQ